MADIIRLPSAEDGMRKISKYKVLGSDSSYKPTATWTLNLLTVTLMLVLRLSVVCLYGMYCG